MKGFSILYKKMKWYFQNYFSKFLDRIFEKLGIPIQLHHAPSQ